MGISKFFQRLVSLAAVAAAIGLTATPSLAASSYPNRPITFIVPFEAGGNGDIVARIAAEGIGKKLGQPVVVENRSGAGGLVGTSQAARSEPDGYTIVLMTNVQVINMLLNKNANVDVIKDFTYVSELTSGSTILLVNSASSLKSIGDMVAFAKANPGKLTYGSAGNGSTAHLSMAYLAYKAGVDMLHIPYKGVPQVMTDLMAGRVDMSFNSTATALDLIASGKMRALGVSSPERSSLSNNLPAIAETVPGYSVEHWQAIAAPKGTPDEVVTKLNQALREILSDPDTVKKINGLGSKAVPTTPAEITELAKREMALWAQVVKEANVKIQ